MRLSHRFTCSSVVLLATGVLYLASCTGGAESPDKARTQSVAEAAGGSLSGAALDAWLLKAPSVPNVVVATGLVSAWINTALLVDAIRRNVPLTDSVTVDSVIMNDAKRGLVEQYLAAEARKLPPVTDKQADSLMARDSVRVFQQIVLTVRAGSDSATIANAIKSARALAQRLQAGGDFAAAVREFSDDTASRARSGYLSPAMRGDLPAPIAGMLWNLSPGAVSQIVPAGSAIRIFRRVPRDESRTLIKTWLAPRLAFHADSVFEDSLSRARGMAIAPDARLRLRAMAVEPVALSPGGPLVTWTGGSLSAATARSILLIYPPSFRAELADASDSLATQFLTGMARREILMPLVGPGTLPGAEARAALAPRYRNALDSLRVAVGRLPAGASPGDAATAYVDSVLAGRQHFLPLPGDLASILRGRATVTVNQRAFDAIVRGAVVRWQELHKNDSTAGRGGIAPAAGPAPVPVPAKAPIPPEKPN